MIFVKKILGVASLIIPYLLLPHVGADGINLSWVQLAVALGTAAVSAYGARKKQGDQYQYGTQLPAGLDFLEGEGQGAALWQEDIMKYLKQAGAELDPQILARMLGSQARGLRGGIDTANRNAALGVGPQTISPASFQLTQGMKGADIQAQFSMMNEETRRRNLSMLQPLFNFYSQQNKMTGRTQTAPGGVAGALQGFGMGLNMYGQMQGAGMFGSNPSVTDTGEGPQNISE